MDVAQDLGSGAHDNVVAEGGMTFAFFLAGAAQRDTLVNQAVVADLGSLADDNTHAMVDEEPAADCRAGMDLDSRKETADLRDDTRQNRYAGFAKTMRKPVREDGVNSGVTEEDFEGALGSRILSKDRLDLFPERLEHALFLIISQNRRSFLTVL
jgi:hypothetical protein